MKFPSSSSPLSVQPNLPQCQVHLVGVFQFILYVSRWWLMYKKIQLQVDVGMESTLRFEHNLYMQTDGNLLIKIVTDRHMDRQTNLAALCTIVMPVSCDHKILPTKFKDNSRIFPWFSRMSKFNGQVHALKFASHKENHKRM